MAEEKETKTSEAGSPDQQEADVGNEKNEAAEAAEDTKEETASADVSSEASAKEEEKQEETKEPETTSDSGVDESVEVPKEFEKLVEQIEKMSVLQLHELVKVLEKRFGVSASAVAVAAPGAGGDAGSDDEQTSFTVELADAGAQKIAVIKVVKEVCGLGLKEAKDMVDGAPSVVKEGVKKEEAEELKKKLEEAGASVNLK